jgi:hypothetical protein
MNIYSDIQYMNPSPDAGSTEKNPTPVKDADPAPGSGVLCKTTDIVNALATAA